jgi:hypothetical protein
MKAKQGKVKYPVFDNKIYGGDFGFHGNPEIMKNEPDKYFFDYVLVCPNCNTILEVDQTDNSKLYCQRCKEYGIEQPEH